jgi:hypothetical protein
VYSNWPYSSAALHSLIEGELIKIFDSTASAGVLSMTKDKRIRNLRIKILQNNKLHTTELVLFDFKSMNEAKKVLISGLGCEKTHR